MYCTIRHRRTFLYLRKQGESKAPILLESREAADNYLRNNAQIPCDWEILSCNLVFEGYPSDPKKLDVKA